MAAIEAVRGVVGKMNPGLNRVYTFLNWNFIQLGSESIISCGIQKGMSFSSLWVSHGEEGNVKTWSHFRFDGTLMLENILKV